MASKHPELRRIVDADWQRELLVDYGSNAVPAPAIEVVQAQIESIRKARPIRKETALGTTRHCLFNIQRRVAQSGGTIVYGWTGQAANRGRVQTMDFIAHAVWRSSEGELVEITDYYPDTCTFAESEFVRSLLVGGFQAEFYFVPNNHYGLMEANEARAHENCCFSRRYVLMADGRVEAT